MYVHEKQLVLALRGEFEQPLFLKRIVNLTDNLRQTRSRTDRTKVMLLAYPASPALGLKKYIPNHEIFSLFEVYLVPIGETKTEFCL